ncbi:hypothetical protein ACF1BN_21310 [Streptomyces sp. NPDC014861]|uniref:hypothetical protein n=1 Tax=Streptomyces sp. NPDC014861 TaxID=3364923 RepID=UPI0036F9BEBD
MNDEPVLIRSKWGTSRYVYNHRSPAGLALIVLTPLLALGVLIGARAESTWSEGEFRDAVHAGVSRLDGGRHYTSPESDHGLLITEAIRESGIGPRYGVDTREEGAGSYTVSTEDTTTAFCARLTLTLDKEPPVVFPDSADLPPPAPDMLAFYVSHATVSNGPCA